MQPTGESNRPAHFPRARGVDAVEPLGQPRQMLAGYAFALIPHSNRYKGAVPGIANLDPALTVRLYEAAAGGAVEEARALQRRLAGLFRVVTFGPPIACFKTALELMGVCSARACRPLQPLGQQARDGIAAILREHELL